MWINNKSDGFQRPANNIRVQILDIQTYDDPLGTHSIGTILIGDDSAPFKTKSNVRPDALKKMIVGHSKEIDTDGVYGHEMDGDQRRAAAMINEAFKRLLQ